MFQLKSTPSKIKSIIEEVSDSIDQTEKRHSKIKLEEIMSQEALGTW